MVSTFRSPRLHNLISSQGRLQRFKKEETVSSTEGQREIMFIVKGYVKRYFITDSGSFGVQIIFGPQDIFSLPNVYQFLLGQSLYEGPETYYYRTMSETQIFTLDGGILQEAIDREPLLYKELFSEAGQHLRTCIHRMESTSLTNAYSRVAHELLFSTQKFGTETSEGLQLLLPLTHQDIADILGVTRETVSKSMGRLRDEGIINGDRRFSIMNVQKLEQAAYL